MAIAFGYDTVPGQKDPFVDVVQFASEKATELVIPGRTVISAIPFLRHIPPWFPGASTQRLGAQINKAFMQHKNEPFDYVKKKMASAFWANMSYS